MSNMYEELNRQHEVIKRTVRSQIDRATSGTQADLADMQARARILRIGIVSCTLVFLLFRVISPRPPFPRH